MCWLRAEDGPLEEWLDSVAAKEHSVKTPLAAVGRFAAIPVKYCSRVFLDHGAREDWCLGLGRGEVG